ncbi:MAG TPA: hypothetical protein VNQ81_14350 [Povalibacter sp.]|nr:hypothetical protein [Povalibacter sp.]
MHRLILLAAILASGCSDPPAGAASSATASGPAQGTRSDSATGVAQADASGNGAAAAATGNVRPALNGRKGEIVNPDDNTVVFLYYDLAGLTPPLDRWVEDDNRVTFAQPIDKAGLRTAIRAELESAAAAVHDIGFIRLSMNARLSDYDPSYGEFTVGALAPSSVVSFDAFKQKVSLRFGNGRTAQIWRVPPDQAQAVRDKVGYFSNVSLDALLRITSVQPGPSGGTLTTEVVEYELRENQRGIAVGRVRVE